MDSLLVQSSKNIFTGVIGGCIVAFFNTDKTNILIITLACLAASGVYYLNYKEHKKMESKK